MSSRFETKVLKSNVNILFKVLNFKFSHGCVAGASIIACRGTNRHIVALEKDDKVFKGVLLPMKKATPVQGVTQATEEVFAALDLDAVDVEPMVFTRNIRSSK